MLYGVQVLSQPSPQPFMRYYLYPHLSREDTQHHSYAGVHRGFQSTSALPEEPKLSFWCGTQEYIVNILLKNTSGLSSMCVRMQAPEEP